MFTRVIAFGEDGPVAAVKGLLMVFTSTPYFKPYHGLSKLGLMGYLVENGTYGI